jgi:SAM-dependent methyltransferase
MQRGTVPRMGMGNVVLDHLIELKGKGALDGVQRVAEIGAQQLTDTFLGSPRLPELFALFGREPVDLGALVGAENFAAAAPPARRLWTALGMESTSIDLVGDAVPIDLNRGKVPWRMRRAFDLVVNLGTTEHVANQENAFRVIHDLTRTGGLMYHEVPASGMLGHGLVTYSPKMFHFLCRENDYRVVLFRIGVYTPSAVPPGIEREPGSLDIAAIHDVALRVALVKQHDKPFVTPLDLA